MRRVNRAGSIVLTAKKSMVLKAKGDGEMEPKCGDKFSAMIRSDLTGS
jgi:hypothetical protein